MKMTTFNTDCLEGQGLPELTASEMADVQGGTAVEYAAFLALYVVTFIASI
jgi:hypothetical protein